MTKPEIIKYRRYKFQIIKKTPVHYVYNINNSGWREVFGFSKKEVMHRIKKEIDWLLNVTPIASRYRGKI